MVKKQLWPALVLIVLVVARPSHAQERVDLILHNGKVFVADELLSTYSAVAVRDGKVVAVGWQDLPKRYQAARTIDLRGRLVVPGFIDTHIHISGDPVWHIDFAGTKSIAEIKARITRKAEQLGSGAWITGYAWSEDELVDKRRPLRWDLDEAAPHNPVIITRAGAHSSVANSLALDAAGLTPQSKPPEGAIIELDEKGQLNGVLREGAQGMVRRLVPEARAEDVRESFVTNLRDLLKLGITSIILAGTSVQGYEEWQTVYRQRPGQLPRAAAQLRVQPNAERAIQAMKALGKKSGDGDEWLRVGPLKLGVDGGYTGAAAWTLEPYKNQPGFFGSSLISEQELYTLSKAAHEMGWQMAFHTIGDAAIKMTVDVWARVISESPRTDHRHFLNHFTVLPPSETMRKMADYNIHIAQQPNFSYTLEGRYVDNLVGDRLQTNNALRTPMDQGVFVALGSDILPIGPLVGLYAAVTRKGMSGTVFGPGERLSMTEAIVGYTRRGAYLTFEEDIKGTLEPGRLADMVVLSRDLLTIEPSEIMNVQVDMTVLGGKVVYERSATTSSQ